MTAMRRRSKTRQRYSIESLLQSSYEKSIITLFQKNMLEDIFRYTKVHKLKRFLQNMDGINTDEMIEWYLLMKSILLSDKDSYPIKLHKELADEIIRIWIPEYERKENLSCR